MLLANLNYVDSVKVMREIDARGVSVYERADSHAKIGVLERRRPLHWTGLPRLL